MTNSGVLGIRWDSGVRGAHPLGFVRGQTVLVQTYKSRIQDGMMKKVLTGQSCFRE